MLDFWLCESPVMIGSWSTFVVLCRCHVYDTWARILPAAYDMLDGNSRQGVFDVTDIAGCFSGLGSGYH